MHLFVDLSAHGYGHLAQTAPVLNALRARLPALRLTLRSALPHTVLARRIDGAFRHLPVASDFGLTMHNALDVDVPASLTRYRNLHAHWPQQVADYAQALGVDAPDLLLSNISYLALAAAHAAGVPALAMCSLNWLDILQPYAPATPEMARIQAQMAEAYQRAQAFLRLTPGMDMPHFSHLVDIGPVAQAGRADGLGLRSALGLSTDEKLVLVSMGGVPLPLPLTWPQVPRVRWIVAQAQRLPRADMIALEDIPRPFGDVLASCDCTVTKSAYGMFTEASANAVPVLYVERPDWPEQACLTDWILRNNRARGISRDTFERGDFAAPLQALLEAPRPAAIAADGAEQAAAFIQSHLERHT